MVNKRNQKGVLSLNSAQPCPRPDYWECLLHCTDEAGADPATGWRFWNPLATGWLNKELWSHWLPDPCQHYQTVKDVFLGPNWTSTKWTGMGLQNELGLQSLLLWVTFSPSACAKVFPEGLCEESKIYPHAALKCWHSTLTRIVYTEN